MANKYEYAFEEILNILYNNHVKMDCNLTYDTINILAKQIVKNKKIKDEYSFYYETSKLLKQIFNIKDSHTQIMNKNKLLLPFKYKIENGEVYIIETIPEYKQFMYARVEKINGIDMKNILEQFKEIIPYATEERLINQIENNYLVDLFKIQSLPVIEDKEKIIIDFGNLGKTEFTKTTIPNLPSLDYQNMKISIFEDTPIFKYNKCYEREQNEMSNAIEKLDAMMKYYNSENIILDLRQNGGGNSEIANPLIQYLKTNQLNAVALVNGGNFSSGIEIISRLKQLGTTFIGTEVGDNYTSFGEIKKQKILDDNFELQYSTKSYIYDKDTNNLNRYNNEELQNILNNPNNYQKQISEYYNPTTFKPDIYCQNTIKDLEKGYDKQLEIAKELINVKKNSKQNVQGVEKHV